MARFKKISCGVRSIVARRLRTEFQKNVKHKRFPRVRLVTGQVRAPNLSCSTAKEKKTAV